MEKSLTIALVAHDACKPDMLEWAEFNAGTLSKHKIVATGTTGELVAQRLNRPVEALLSGPWGGDQQIGSRLAMGGIDLLVFFWDPLSAQPHDTDVKALLRVAVLHNVPVACNRATADFLISSPLLGSGYTAEQPSSEEYTSRDVPGVDRRSRDEGNPF